jgi:hypothetical protein
VLSYPFWQSEFGGDYSAIGSRLIVQGHPLEIIGVAPAGFSGPEIGSHFDLALPQCAISVLNDGDTTAFDRPRLFLAQRDGQGEARLDACTAGQRSI